LLHDQIKRILEEEGKEKEKQKIKKNKKKGKDMIPARHAFHHVGRGGAATTVPLQTQKVLGLIYLQNRCFFKIKLHYKINIPFPSSPFSPSHKCTTSAWFSKGYNPIFALTSLSLLSPLSVTSSLNNK
jgi:hypothetical protein